MKHFKIKVSWLWIPFLLCYPFISLWKTLGFIFWVLSIHELAHILTALFFHYPVQKVILYPFGLCAIIDSLGMRSGSKDMMILAAGPMTHFLQPLLLGVLLHFQLISKVYFDYLNMMNFSILLFNLLPVYPLDGGRMMELIIEYFFPYTTALRIVYGLSVISILLCAYYSLFTGFSGFAVCCLLVAENLMAFFSVRWKRLRFYHYRLEHPAHYRMRLHRKKDLYRFHDNVLLHHEHWLSEPQWLSIFFHNKIG